MSTKSDVKKAVEWYREKRGIFEALAKRVESVIREILHERKINYYSISSRAKSIESYEAKASKEKYKDPLSEIEDMAGIRVITYTDSDAKTVSQIIQKLFEIQPEHAVDKTEELGTDRVGYRSIHCVGTLGDERVKLPENKIFKGMCFEIQIRTILQHAWAEFEHDRNYKFSGVLPKDIQRRLSIVAGNLELVDREFDNISKAIDSYTLEIRGKTESGDLHIPINSTSLKTYLENTLKVLIEAGVEPNFDGNDKTIIDEMTAMGISTIKELDDIVPKDYVEKRLKHRSFEPEQHNLIGVVRDFLMIHNIDAYFKKAWKDHWNSILEEDVGFFKEYGIDLKKYAELHGFKIMEV
jgi:ppGpp synthetase/RelA/SpoT-type nucleotidyltranferase